MAQPPLSADVQLLRAPDADERLLVVAPHMDDETIAAGGFAGDAIARGADVSVVFLTAGDCNRSCARLLFRTWNPSAAQYLAVGRTRIREARAAMNHLGLAPDRVFNLGYPDQGLGAMVARPHDAIVSPATAAIEVPYDDAVSAGARHTLGNLVGDLARVIELTRPTTLVAPVELDFHDDHRAAATIVRLALDRTSIRPRRLGYLVHQSRYIKSFVWRRDGVIAPPRQYAGAPWSSYALHERTLQKKNDVLQHYDSQRPYLTLLRNAFVRSNELFYVYGEERSPALYESEPVGALGDELLALS